MRRLREATAAALLAAAFLAPGQRLAAEPPSPAAAWKVAAFSVENPPARFRAALTGYAQHDTRSYRDWTAVDDLGDPLRRPDNEWRRVRLGAQGSWRALDFRGEIAPNNRAGDRLNDAWIGLRLKHGLRVRLGRQKLPGGPEWLSSNATTDLMERAVAVDALSPGRAAGVQLFVDGELVDAQAGVFHGDQSPSPANAGTTEAGGFVLKPRPWLDLGGSFSHGEVAATTSGLAAKSVTGYPLWRAIATRGTRDRLAAHVALRLRSFGLKSEVLRRREERNDVPTGRVDDPVVGHGFSVTATWLLTGEPKARVVRPRHALPHGPGAVELAARYEELEIGEANDASAGLRATTVGVSWWPVSVVRLMGNALFERYGNHAAAPERGRPGTYFTLLARAQVSLP